MVGVESLDGAGRSAIEVGAGTAGLSPECVLPQRDPDVSVAVVA
jgi:hypothetical protein